jgi:hypothetical protein
MSNSSPVFVAKIIPTGEKFAKMIHVAGQKSYTQAEENVKAFYPSCKILDINVLHSGPTQQPIQPDEDIAWLVNYLEEEELTADIIQMDCDEEEETVVSIRKSGTLIRRLIREAGYDVGLLSR